MAQEPPFRFLDKAEYEKLPREEQVSYLARAIHKLTANPDGQPPQQTLYEQTKKKPD